MVSPGNNEDLWADIEALRREIAAFRGKEQKLADMVQCLFGEILDAPVDRPGSFDDSLHKLSVLKREGGATRRLLLRALEKATDPRASPRDRADAAQAGRLPIL